MKLLMAREEKRAAKGESEGAAFLEGAAAVDGAVTTDTGLIYLETVRGEGKQPVKEDSVKVTLSIQYNTYIHMSSPASYSVQVS